MVNRVCGRITPCTTQNSWPSSFVSRFAEDTDTCGIRAPTNPAHLSAGGSVGGSRRDHQGYGGEQCQH